MNERIQELAKQAKEYAKKQTSHTMIPDLYSARVFEEKFAELIVQECMNICDEVQAQYGQYTFTATTCKNRFKEHFGVE